MTPAATGAWNLHVDCAAPKLFSSEARKRQELPRQISTAAMAKNTSATKKATQAQKAALKGTNGKIQKKIRTTATFHRPSTLKLARTPKYPRKSVPHAPRLDEFKVIVNPLNTESAMKKIEENNTLVFICDIKANKYQIKVSERVSQSASWVERR
ncbi:hypothetical protein G7K_2824-t1 [Saitoella complicata NRRL Y-17804]|uniref:Large ribosomal subunit protein uL23 N-terminal domain-containing protein n=1 Tax=Saitoella complicata (strain BCRC 22490 / CBS 7301 / JCM 7358 / NBRC 10748 / NRRL Y-17804) TaxID=698492 RepID=A0A0E9NFN9_SAICN|nr:hypothetical protein G7K_2824-t1 [Saitoella complicata NRRL Y-17804]